MAATYRVSVSTGGWRSLPWPFGLLSVNDDGLRVHSWRWSWWVADKDLNREEIASIEHSKRLGAVKLRITTVDGKEVHVRPALARETLLRDLKERAYPVH